MTAGDWFVLGIDVLALVFFVGLLVCALRST